MSVWRVPINLEWPGPGSPGANVWSVRTEGTVGSDELELQDAVDALHTFYVFAANKFVGGTKITLGEVTERTSQTRGTPTFSMVTSTNASGAAPPALQVVIGWRTSIAARRGMGRTFIGPLGRDMMQDDGTVTETLLGELRTTTQTLLDSSLSSVNGYGLGVWGLESAAPPGTVDYTNLPRVHRDFTDFRIRDKFSVLRSRRD